MSDAAQPVVCAHRGASLALPDNSIEAFATAITLGVDFIETDVRMSGGVPVLAHDPEDVVPGAATLADLMRLARGRVGLDLEIAEPGYEAQVIEAVADWDGPLLITSIHPELLSTVRRLAPDLATGYVHENFYEGDPFEIADGCGASATLVEHDIIDAAMLDRAVAEDRRLWAWTVNDADRLAELFVAPGVAGVISDDPATARAVRDSLTSRSAGPRPTRR